jgi:TolB-like protein
MKRSFLKKIALHILPVCACMVAMSAPAFAEPARIALFPFDIRSKQDLAFLADGIYNMLESRLYYKDQVEIVGRGELEKALGENRTPSSDEALRTIGAGLKAGYALTGNVVVSDDGPVTVTARMVDLTGNKPPFESAIQGNGIADILPTISSLAADINQKAFNRQPKVESTGEAAEKKQVNVHAHPETIQIEE